MASLNGVGPGRGGAGPPNTWLIMILVRQKSDTRKKGQEGNGYLESNHQRHWD